MEERPELFKGDTFEFNGEKWIVTSNNGFMLHADNLDKSSKCVAITWIGNITDNNYTFIKPAS